MSVISADTVVEEAKKIGNAILATRKTTKLRFSDFVVLCRTQKVVFDVYRVLKSVRL